MFIYLYIYGFAPVKVRHVTLTGHEQDNKRVIASKQEIRQTIHSVFV